MNSATTPPVRPDQTSTNVGTADRAPRWRPSRSTTHRILVANLAGQIVLVATGGAVRLTGSGLGCSTWPQCEPGSFTPEFHEALSVNAAIEFGNRTLTFFLSVIVAAVAYVLWSNRSRPLGLRRLGLVPLAGVVLQALIGGAIVLLDLNPAVVGVHMLISLSLVAASAVLIHWDARPEGQARPALDPRILTMGRALLGLGVVLVTLGVVVTGAGPHGGDDDVAYRFAVDPVLIARLHAGAVWAFGAVLLAIVWRARRSPVAAVRKAWFGLLGVTLAQGAIGYVQYFTKLPAVLVGFHMLGAALLTAALTWALLSLRTWDRRSV